MIYTLFGTLAISPILILGYATFYNRKRLFPEKYKPVGAW